jgi:hypothetical protein
MSRNAVPAQARPGVLFPFLGAALLLLAACGDAGSEAQPEAPGAACPVIESICSFADEVEKTAIAGDFSEVVRDAEPAEYACPGSPPRSLGGPFPLCDGASRGESRPGFDIAYVPGERAVVDRDGLLRALSRWVTGARPEDRDAFGDGATRLFTIGCAADGCGDGFALVLSNLGSVPFRLEAVLYFKRAGESMRLTWVALGSFTDLTGDATLLKGGDTEKLAAYEGWPDLTTFHPWRR